MRTLKNEIKSHGYKLKDVADELGITYKTLWCKMSYQTSFKKLELMKLSQMLNIPEQEIRLMSKR